MPRWRLDREGPFPNERSQASLCVLGKGCAFRHTTYKWEDHARPEGGLGVSLNHPRFLEWLGAPVRHVIQRPDHDSGYAATQRRLPHANELRHSRPIRSGTTRDSVETVTEYYWWRSLPWSGSGVGGTRDTCTPSFSANGGTGAVETQYGPITVRSNTIMNT